MTIDKTGKWWKGEGFQDLVEYVKLLTSDSYPARDVVQSVCQCGGRVFVLEADRDEGCARRKCTSCGTLAYIGDSEELAHEARFSKCKCPCKGNEFEIGVGFSFRETGDVKWVTVGERCVRCGILGAYVDWKVDYSPTDHLLSKA